MAGRLACAPVSSGDDSDMGINLSLSLHQSQRQTASQALHCLLTQNKDGPPWTTSSTHEGPA